MASASRAFGEVAGLCLLPSIVLAGCSGAATEAEVDPDSLIECAQGVGELVRECAVERDVLGGVLFLTVRHPDGAFRRIEVLEGGRGLAAADGAEIAQVDVRDGVAEVALGGNRYRFPASMTADGDDTP